MTETAHTVTLSRHERKDRLGHGGIKDIAAIAGVDPALVSRVVNGKQRHPRVEAIITGRIARPGEQVFPPAEPRRRREAAAA
jgi:hypothetical protein